MTVPLLTTSGSEVETHPGPPLQLTGHTIEAAFYFENAVEGVSRCAAKPRLQIDVLVHGSSCAQKPNHAVNKLFESTRRVAAAKVPKHIGLILAPVRVYLIEPARVQSCAWMPHHGEEPEGTSLCF
jgi:hypothetical protein